MNNKLCHLHSMLSLPLFSPRVSLWHGNDERARDDTTVALFDWPTAQLLSNAQAETVNRKMFNFDFITLAYGAVKTLNCTIPHSKFRCELPLKTKLFSFRHFIYSARLLHSSRKRAHQATFVQKKKIQNSTKNEQLILVFILIEFLFLVFSLYILFPVPISTPSSECVVNDKSVKYL